MLNNYDSRILFKQLLADNMDEIKVHMAWNNYELNDVIIPVVDSVQDHALMVLSKSYGLFHVEPDIIDPLIADIFIYFPILLQQLAITRLIDAYGVVKDDVDTVVTKRTEVLANETDQNSTITVGTTNTDRTISDNQQKNTGTVIVDNDATNIQRTTNSIINISGVESTGSRNVNVGHNMPEQSINGVTKEFPVDNQGTPILSSSTIQNGSETFNTSNPINSNETSDSQGSVDNSGTSNAKTTNDITVSETGNNTRTSSNSGSDNSESNTKSDSMNTIDESVTSTMTNKQYAYEIKAFLETADSLIAFRKWESHFSWVVGIV